MALLAKVVLTGRVDDRRLVRLDGTLRFENKPFDIVIEDLSVSGFGVTTDADLRPGDCVIIGAPAIEIREAEVIWAKDGRVGFEFFDRLQRSEVAAALPVDTVVQLPAAGDMLAREGRILGRSPVKFCRQGA